MAETWTEEDITRTHGILTQQLQHLFEVSVRALAEIEPRLKTQFPKLDRIQIAPDIYWPGDGIQAIQCHGKSKKMDSGIATKMGICRDIIKSTKHEPRLLLTAINKIKEASRILKKADNERRENAQAMLEEQAQDIHELRSLFVAEELKKSNDQ